MRALRQLAFVAVLAAWTIAATGASAQTCTASFSDIRFGTPDLTGDTAVNGTGELAISCSGFASGATVRVCPQIDAGSGGAGSSGLPRYLAHESTAGATLAVGVYSDAGRTATWGAQGFGLATVPRFDIAINGSGAGNLTVPVYARILAGQRTARVGTYASTLSASVGYSATPGATCDQIGASGGVSPSFIVDARVQPHCVVSASDMVFPPADRFTTNWDTTSRLAIVCTLGAVYHVGLDGGLSRATNPTMRQMRQGQNSITYGLYHDDRYLRPWGDRVEVDTASGTGTGSTQEFIIYGRIPPQAPQPPGTYTDTVSIVVTY